MTEAAPPKPKCPECGTELVLVDGKLPDECAKCKFVLDGFEDYQRWFKAAWKAAKAGDTPPPPPPAPKRRSLFGPRRK